MNTHVLVLIFAYLSSSSQAEDVVVAVGKQLELVSGGHLTGQLPLGSFNATSLVALAYDSASRRIFFSDIKHHRASVLSVGLDAADVEKIVARGGEESVEGLTFDSVDQTLLWTDGSQRLIRRVNITSPAPNDETGASVELVHFLGNDKPRALVADPCTRMLYWTNWKRDGSTIERSFINGSHRGVVFSEDLLMPHGLTLDIREQRLYWVNNLYHSSFRIESGLVDGTDRRLIHQGLGQFVFGLALGLSDIYWTDWQNQALWRMPRNSSAAEKPQLLGHFAHKPMAIVVLSDAPVACDAVKLNLKALEAQEKLLANQEEEEEELGKIPELHFADLAVDPCANFCLNGGNCSVVDEKPTCSCREGCYGDRCQVDLDTYLAYWPTSTLLTAGTNQRVLVALIVVSSVCLLLIVAVAVMAVQLKRFSRRPKLRRRFVGVAKKKTTTPPSAVIDIENCCNMNLCETPCFEPPSRTPTSSPSKIKTEDKQGLLTDEDVVDA